MPPMSGKMLVLSPDPTSHEEKGLVSSACFLNYVHYQLLHNHGTLCIVTLYNTHGTCVGIGTTTDNADLQSDWHVEISL